MRARRGVVLAIGGYDHNEKLASSSSRCPTGTRRARPTCDGDHFVMAGEVGAAIASVPPTNLAMFYGYQIPGEEHEGVPLFRSSWECGCPHAIWVNQKGERFCDESFYKDYQPRLRHWDGKKQTQPNLPPFLIFDENYRERYPLGSFMPGQPLPEELVVRPTRRASWPRSSASTPAGSSARSRASTSSRAKGEDPDFGKGSRPWAVRLVGDPSYPNPCVGPLDKPPYYGVKLVPGRRRHQLARPRDRRQRAGAARARPADPGPLRGRQLGGAARPRRRLPERHLEHARDHLGLRRRPPRRRAA